MSPQQIAALVFAALVIIGAASVSAMHATAPVLTSYDLTVFAQNAGQVLLTAGKMPPANTTWTATDPKGNKITLTVLSASATKISIQAQSNDLTVVAGAKSQ